MIARDPGTVGHSPIGLEESAALVLAEDLAHRATDLADRCVGRERVADGVEQVALTFSDLTQLCELRVDSSLVAVLLELLEPLELALLGLGVDLEDVDV